jgi:hypothetical protein
MAFLAFDGFPELTGCEVLAMSPNAAGGFK